MSISTWPYNHISLQNQVQRSRVICVFGNRRWLPFNETRGAGTSARVITALPCAVAHEFICITFRQVLCRAWVKEFLAWNLVCIQANKMQTSAAVLTLSTFFKCKSNERPVLFFSDSVSVWVGCQCQPDQKEQRDKGQGNSNFCSWTGSAR